MTPCLQLFKTVTEVDAYSIMVKNRNIKHIVES